MKLPSSYFFLDTELLLIDLELGTHTKKLKKILKSNKKEGKKKRSYIQRDSYIDLPHHISAFSGGNLAFT